MPPAELDRARRDFAAHWGRQDGEFAVHPANGPALRLLLAMSTQWRVVTMSTMARAIAVRTGLDYAALATVAEHEGLAPIAPADFRRLRLLEAECLAAWREERDA